MMQTIDEAKVEMDGTVQYILRVVGLSFGNDAEWEETLRFAEAGNFDAIMCFNAHGEMPPHPTLEEIRLRVPLFAERFAEIRERGMAPMLNFFVTLGHGESKPAAGMGHFQPLVDGLGNQPTGCACPLDASFLDYITTAFSLYAAAEADSIWIDDDFRLFGRDGTETLQCFCPLHLEQFARRSGRLYARAELYAKLMQQDKPDRELRNQWFTLQGDSLLQLANQIKEAVVAANSRTGLGIMVVPPFMNYLSGRDLNAEISALQTEALPAPWVRTGGGFYNDERPLDLLDKIVAVADPLPAVVQTPALWCSEIENYPFPVGYKSAKLLQLEMYLNTISVNGLLTFSIHDFYLGMHDPSGNITPMLRATKPYLAAVVQAEQGKVRKGCSFPYHPQLAEVRELKPDKFASKWNLNLARLGITQAPTDASPLLLIGTTANLYTNEEIHELLMQGAVLDAEAYWLLCERGLLAECPIAIRKEAMLSKIQTERIYAEHAPSWLKNKNLAVRWHVSYLEGYTLQALEGAEAWSNLFDAAGNFLSAGVIVTEKPYRLAVVMHSGEPMRELGRQWLMQHVVNYAAKGNYPAMVEGTLNQYPVWWEGKDEALLGLSNFGLESFHQLLLWLPADRQIKSIQRLNRDGIWIQANYSISVHDYQGYRVLLNGDSVPGPLSFETFLVRYLI